MPPEIGPATRRGCAAATAGLVLLAGCAGPPPPPPVENDVAAALAAPIPLPDLPGRWGLAVTAVDIVEPLPRPQGRGEAALTSAKDAAAGAMNLAGEAATSIDDPGDALFAVALGLVTAPIAALVGAGVGLARGNDVATIDAADEAVRRTVADHDGTAVLRRRLLAAAAEAGRPLVSCHEATTPATCRDADGHTVDALLRVEIGPPAFRFRREEIDPVVTPVLAATGTLLHGEPPRPAVARTWTWAGPPAAYLTLAADGAAPLAATLDTGAAALAADIARDLPPPVQGP